MPRYKLLIEYDGTDFVGWQKQALGFSVQSVLEAACTQMFGEAIDVVGSGRTDAGVHASGQVAHIQTSSPRDCFVLTQALNALVRPHGVSILESVEVPETFHARFSADMRHYTYRMIMRRAPLALERNRAWHIYKPLDIDAMIKASKHLLGQHDFSAFRAAQCQAPSPIKTIETLELIHQGENLFLNISAKSFLHHMVRNITGTLKLVGESKIDPGAIPQILESKARKKAGPTAPACGLYLTKVEYPQDLQGRYRLDYGEDA